MAAWRPDLRYAFRRLSKSSGFAAAATVSIALGIGANAAILSMISRFVLRPAPVDNPSALMALHTTRRGECCNHFTWPSYTGLRGHAKSFSGIAAYYELIPASINGSGEPERVWGEGSPDCSRLWPLEAALRCGPCYCR